MPNRDSCTTFSISYCNISPFFCKEKIDISTVSNAVRECDSQHSSVVGKRVVIETAIVFDL
jgi:hypothetical protein